MVADQLGDEIWGFHWWQVTDAGEDHESSVLDAVGDLSEV